jgi:hypothetical protein
MEGLEHYLVFFISQDWPEIDLCKKNGRCMGKNNN